MTTLDLLNLTPEQRNDAVNEAVAVHVAGWRYSDFSGLWTAACGFPSVKVPPFVTSADAVLPLLVKIGMWKADQFLPHDICQKGLAMRVSVANRLDSNFSYADADTFTLAACIAILRAHGIQVLT